MPLILHNSKYLIIIAPAPSLYFDICNYYAFHVL